MLSTTLLSSPLQLINPDLAQKPIVPRTPVSNQDSFEKHRSFAINNYVMQHHQGFQKLNIAVDCTFNQVTSASALLGIYSEISQFLRNYPNEDDYWEIINREMTKTILHNRLDLSSISITLEVLSTDYLPYPRASIVTRNRNGTHNEGWRFITRVPIQGQREALNYEVEYLYRDGITNTEYPDFIPISNRVSQLLITAMNEGKSLEYVNQDIAENILRKYRSINSFTGHIETQKRVR